MSAPVYDRHGVQVHVGDCLGVMRQLPDASVHAIVTDPPAGIRFMNRAWDSDMGGRHSWVAWLSERMQEAHRVLKPGGYGLVWALPRTSHWTAWALEDAGFEIRDCVVHLFGNGFPKSLDVSKAIDKDAQGQMRCAKLAHFASARGVGGQWLEAQGVASAASFRDWTVGGHVPSDRNWSLIRDALGVTLDEEAAFEREVLGVRTTRTANALYGNGAGTNTVTLDTAPATPEAARWSGWSTALKPSADHWWLIRKPPTGTVAANVQEHDTGALNVDACRVEGVRDRTEYGLATATRSQGSTYGTPSASADFDASKGRWPTNTVLTHSYDCAGACVPGCPVAELGTTARTFPTFRYEPKAPTSERPMVGGKSHETVKPIALMRWMVRLVCVPGGTVLDCFAGSGTTGQAARAEGMRAVLIEADPDHIDKIRARLDARPKTTVTEVAADEPMDLLDLLDGGAA